MAGRIKEILIEGDKAVLGKIKHKLKEINESNETVERPSEIDVKPENTMLSLVHRSNTKRSSQTSGMKRDFVEKDKKLKMPELKKRHFVYLLQDQYAKQAKKGSHNLMQKVLQLCHPCRSAGEKLISHIQMSISRNIWKRLHNLV